MAELTFNTPAGQTVDRALLIAYLNTGDAEAPVWSAVGKRVEDSSTEYDWSEESKQDILGQSYTTLKKPVITQTFDPCERDSGDAAPLKMWNLALQEQNIAALANLDRLLVHLYAGTTGAAFAERYSGCTVKPSSLGGEGGGNIGMPIDVTYGGVRTTGTEKVAAGVVNFTADVEV